MALEIKTFALGMIAANCYIVRDTESGDSFVVDPGAYLSGFEEMLEEMKIEKLRYILLTHGHFDHIMGVKSTKQNYGGKTVIHCDDAPCATDSSLNLSKKIGMPCESFDVDIQVKDGDKLAFGDTVIEVIHTPGHTVGSVCYKIGDVLFTGDTLFKMTIGRTDFPGGSYDEIEQSLKRLYDMEGDFKVYPGHDGATTLDFERNNNPYMKGI